MVQYDDQEDGVPSGGDSDTGSDGVKRRRGAVGRKRGRVSGRGSAAGPPVDGALARVDVWQPDCDIHGNPYGKVHCKSDSTIHTTKQYHFPFKARTG